MCMYMTIPQQDIRRPINLGSDRSIAEEWQDHIDSMSEDTCLCELYEDSDMGTDYDELSYTVQPRRVLRGRPHPFALTNDAVLRAELLRATEHELDGSECDEGEYAGHPPADLY